MIIDCEYFKANTESFIYSSHGDLYVAMGFDSNGKHHNGWSVETMLSEGLLRHAKIKPLERLPKWF